jgi:hypothetical protein
VFALHLLDDSTVSIGVAEPGTGRAFDLYLQQVVALNDEDTVAFMDPEGGAYFAPVVLAEAAQALAANPAGPRVIPFARRRALQSDFVSGYDAQARAHALAWRQRGVSEQVILAAGVFSLASVRQGIKDTLRLTTALMPYLIDGKLPSRQKLVAICTTESSGLQESRPDWFLAFEAFVPQIEARLREGGLRDDELRRALSVDTPLPRGMSLAKLSFTLALVGNNCGCLDARVLQWAYGSPAKADEVSSYLTAKTQAGTVSKERYARYREAERKILTATPYYDPQDPVGLARAQWMLWEQMGKAGPEQHDHKEFFDAAAGVKDASGTTASGRRPMSPRR